jgi:chromosome segregation ATPase
MLLEIDALAAGNKGKEAELCEMQAQLESTEALLSETKEQFCKVIEERNGLIEELATAQAETALVKSNLAELCEVLPQLESRETQLIEALAKSKEEHQIASEERDALIDELATAHATSSAQLSELKAQLVKSENRRTEANEELQMAVEARDSLIEELATAHANKTELDAAHARLQRDEAQLREALAKAKKELQVAGEANSKLTEELAIAHAKAQEDKAFDAKVNLSFSLSLSHSRLVC